MDDTAGRRLVPRWPDAFSELHAIASRHGWRTLEPGAGDAWVAGWDAEAGTLVAWHEDPDTDVEYAVVQGDARAAVEEVIRREMELLTPDRFRQAVDAHRAPLLRGRALMAVAVASPNEPDALVSSLVLEAMADADPYIRRYGLYAAEVLGWSALRSAAERLRIEDVDPDVRATASEVLGDG